MNHAMKLLKYKLGSKAEFQDDPAFLEAETRFNAHMDESFAINDALIRYMDAIQMMGDAHGILGSRLASYYRSSSPSNPAPIAAVLEKGMVDVDQNIKSKENEANMILQQWAQYCGLLKSIKDRIADRKQAFENFEYYKMKVRDLRERQHVEPATMSRNEAKLSAAESIYEGTNSEMMEAFNCLTMNSASSMNPHLRALASYVEATFSKTSDLAVLLINAAKSPEEFGIADCNAVYKPIMEKYGSQPLGNGQQRRTSTRSLLNSNEGALPEDRLGKRGSGSWGRGSGASASTSPAVSPRPQDIIVPPEIIEPSVDLLTQQQNQLSSPGLQQQAQPTYLPSDLFASPVATTTSATTMNPINNNIVNTAPSNPNIETPLPGPVPSVSQSAALNPPAIATDVIRAHDSNAPAQLNPSISSGSLQAFDYSAKQPDPVVSSEDSKSRAQPWVPTDELVGKSSPWGIKKTATASSSEPIMSSNMVDDASTRSEWGSNESTAQRSLPSESPIPQQIQSTDDTSASSGLSPLQVPLVSAKTGSVAKQSSNVSSGIPPMVSQSNSNSQLSGRQTAASVTPSQSWSNTTSTPVASTQIEPQTSAQRSTEKVLHPGMTVKALFDYVPSPETATSDEMPFKKDDVMRIMDEVEDGWWRAELGGTVGIVPFNYVRPV